MNLGSPDNTSVPAVRRYLNEFLMDKRVIDVPWLLRVLIVKGIVTPFRAPKSAAAYETIWTTDGSPLVHMTALLRDRLAALIDEPIEIGMRYGNPSTAEGFEKLLSTNPNLEEIVALPLYPHYAMSSFETAVEYAKEIHQRKGYKFKLSFVDPYYNRPAYIEALAASMLPYLAGSYDHMLFSYHGVPGRHIRKSDVTGKHCLITPNCCEVASPAHAHCYRHQCLTTTKLVTSKLGIAAGRYSISFQSRLGKGWLEPFTDIRLAEMPKEGIKKLLILCPAFVSDCLETLEEIAERGKEIFMEAGGEAYTMIPCMNLEPKWVSAMKELVSGTTVLEQHI